MGVERAFTETEAPWPTGPGTSRSRLLSWSGCWC
jgi:hypothetical protein